MVWGVTRWGDGKWSDGALFTKLRDELDGLNKSKSNNTMDGKHVLGQIYSQSDNSHGLPLSK